MGNQISDVRDRERGTGTGDRLRDRTERNKESPSHLLVVA
jgi:hypothetical protein